MYSVYKDNHLGNIFSLRIALFMNKQNETENCVHIQCKMLNLRLQIVKSNVSNLYPMWKTQQKNSDKKPLMYNENIFDRQKFSFLSEIKCFVNVYL